MFHDRDRDRDCDRDGDRKGDRVHEHEFLLRYMFKSYIYIYIYIYACGHGHSCVCNVHGYSGVCNINIDAHMLPGIREACLQDERANKNLSEGHRVCVPIVPVTVKH
jgi:hypothetical protein